MLRYAAAAVKRAAPLLSTRTLGVVAIGLALLVPKPAYADATDVRLRVVFYPAIIAPPTDDAATPARFSADDVQANLLQRVATRIMSAHPLYFTCFYDLAKPTPDCNPTTANILITTQFNPDPKSTDAAHPDYTVTMRSLDVINGRFISTQSLGTLKDSALTAVANASPVAKALADLVPSADVVSKLIGMVTINNGRLSLFQGYEPYIQLVPTLANSNDPSYLSLMTNLLSRRHLTGVPSQFNAGVVASGNTALDVICGRGQRYLVYGLFSEPYGHQATFSTRIQTHATAQLYDCTTMSVIPVGLDQHVNVLTTKGPLTSLLSIIQAAFFWQSKDVSPVPLNVIGLVSPFVDAVPDSDPVKHSVADRALQGLVDKLCTRLDELAKATPPFVPALPPLVIRVTGPGKALTSAELQQRRQAKADMLRAKADMESAKNALETAADTLHAARSADQAKARAAFDAALNVYETKMKAYGTASRKYEKMGAVGSNAFADNQSAPQPPPAAQPGAPQGPTLTSLDVSGFLAPSPPPLHCDGEQIDKWSGSAWDPGRWTPQ
jgi:hypothetical protein